MNVFIAVYDVNQTLSQNKSQNKNQRTSHENLLNNPGDMVPGLPGGGYDKSQVLDCFQRVEKE